ncbi:MAG: DUF1080 domain-containing protein [Lentisphaeraceae bacterium]|nr:DUF1080 domain-containing protein [Lentisphaeraceae bacterium]
MTRSTITLVMIGLQLCLNSLSAQTQDTKWTEDFDSIEQFNKNWHNFNRTMHGDKTKRFWLMPDGVIEGLAYKKIHPVGVYRKSPSKNLSLSCRVKMEENTGIYFTISGMNRGIDHVKPHQTDINFRRCTVHLRSAGKANFYDEKYIHLSEAELKDKGIKRTKNVRSVNDYKFEIGVWHDIKIEMQGKYLILWINGKKIKEHKTQSGDEGKTTIAFSVAYEGKSTKTVVRAQLDDMKFEALPSK